uniref:Uncharacterized protein n=1 Tax=Candidatus Kentrum sp. FW TaxID=2126338 RepID=A0A450TLK0_9GAMM|nr:MAG: hypothetical protein BECKFW1821C_GA0114237_101517 [Candidatus Kentron sp. FW]
MLVNAIPGIPFGRIGGIAEPLPFLALLQTSGADEQGANSQEQASLSNPRAGDNRGGSERHPDESKTSDSHNFVASPLYYFGILTFGGISPFGKSILTIPNLVIRKLYAESIREMLLPEGKDREVAEQATRALYQHGDIRPLCEFVEQKYFKVFSNRDYAHVNELTVKTAFLTLLFNDTLYIMESETEVQRGHTDLTMIVRPDMRL